MRELVCGNNQKKNEDYTGHYFLSYYYSITANSRIYMEDSSVTDDELKKQEKPGIRLPEKKNLVIAGIVVALLVIAVIAIVFIQLPAGKGTAQPAVIKNFTQLKREYLLNKPKISKKRSVRQVPALSYKHQQYKKPRHYRSILSSSRVTRRAAD